MIYGSILFMEEFVVFIVVFVENKLYVNDVWLLIAGLCFDDFKCKVMIGMKDFDEVIWLLGMEWDVISDWMLFVNVCLLFKGLELLEIFVCY